MLGIPVDPQSAEREGKITKLNENLTLLPHSMDTSQSSLSSSKQASPCSNSKASCLAGGMISSSPLPFFFPDHSSAIGYFSIAAATNIELVAASRRTVDTKE
jgi:hypothetical protein